MLACVERFHKSTLLTNGTVFLIYIHSLQRILPASSVVGSKQIFSWYNSFFWKFARTHIKMHCKPNDCQYAPKIPKFLRNLPFWENIWRLGNFLVFGTFSGVTACEFLFRLHLEFPVMQMYCKNCYFTGKMDYGLFDSLTWCTKIALISIV